MFTLASKSDADKDAEELYTKSYLLIRTVVGALGIALPLMLWVGEAFMEGGFRTRGSLSAYYHTSMRDLFVGTLCVTGVLLITYMAASPRSKEFYASTVAGFAVLGVAFLPTGRPDLARDAIRCGGGTDPAPPGCTPLQQTFGENLVAGVHFFFALVFIVALAAICAAFARDERERRPVRARLHLTCARLIVGALLLVGAGAALDFDGVLGLTPLYVAELIAVLAFGLSWLVKGYDLAAAARRMLPGRWLQKQEPRTAG